MSDCLHPGSRRALADDSLDGSGIIILNEFLDAEILTDSVVVTRAQMMMKYARDNDGIDLTASGALNRKFLTWAVEAFNWPGYEPEEIYAMNKVVNQIDYMPSQYLHEVMKRQKFMRKHKNQLVLSPAGRQALNKPCLLQHALFRETFVGRYLSSLDACFMGDFDLYFGLLLWQIRHATQNWASVRKVFEVSVMPDDAIYTVSFRYPDAPIHCFYLRILRFLCWFGLLESKQTNRLGFDADVYCYRATPLFDRFVHFNFPANNGSNVLQ